MRSFLVRQIVSLVVGVLGAVLIAAVISAIGEPRAPGVWPFLVAAGSRLVHFLEGDFGQSAITGTSALHVLGHRLPPTLTLLAEGAALAVAVGLPLGLLFSLGAARRATAPLMQIITATPVFCAGLALAWGAVNLLHWPVSVNMPVGAAVSPDEALQIDALPIVTVGLAGAAAVQLALRRAASQAGGESFRAGLKSLGLGGFEIERVFVVPQVLAGLAASAGEIMLALLSATVVTEWVFHRSGAADLFVKSVALADWNIVAIILFVFAGLTFVAEFIGRIAGRALASEGRP
ncbi:MAG TPA: ABC transporter permease subunit [Rhizomicrobium sp.]|nr:ABC transporter permease subunit [Rhizomicrobium sp.]